MAGLSIPDVRGILAWWNRHMMVNRYKYASKQRSTRVGPSLPKMRRTHDYESAVRRYPKNKIRICEKNSNFLADSYFAVPSTPVSHSVSLGVFTCNANDISAHLGQAGIDRLRENHRAGHTSPCGSYWKPQYICGILSAGAGKEGLYCFT